MVILYGVLVGLILIIAVLIARRLRRAGEVDAPWLRVPPSAMNRPACPIAKPPPELKTRLERRMAGVAPDPAPAAEDERRRRRDRETDDLLSPLNPLSPISPLNPLSPISPMHHTPAIDHSPSPSIDHSSSHSSSHFDGGGHSDMGGGGGGGTSDACSFGD